MIGRPDTNISSAGSNMRVPDISDDRYDHEHNNDEQYQYLDVRAYIYIYKLVNRYIDSATATMLSSRPV